jgi:hypothetical protein
MRDLLILFVDLVVTIARLNVTASPCGVPATAQAFVFNATVAPPGPLGFITMWPQGQTQPLAATIVSR